MCIRDRLPADRDALDVLRAELLCRLRALAAERQGEVAELAEANLLALQQLLAHCLLYTSQDEALCARRAQHLPEGGGEKHPSLGIGLGIYRSQKSHVYLSLIHI